MKGAEIDQHISIAKVQFLKYLDISHFLSSICLFNGVSYSKSQIRFMFSLKSYLQPLQNNQSFKLFDNERQINQLYSTFISMVRLILNVYFYTMCAYASYYCTVKVLNYMCTIICTLGGCSNL